jgi:hypothetical protein
VMDHRKVFVRLGGHVDESAAPQGTAGEQTLEICQAKR